MMNELNTYVFDGVLRTVSHVHITDTDKSARWDAQNNRIAYGKVGFPLTRTRSVKLMVGLKSVKNDDGDEESESMFQDRFPVIPASTWRGMLRRGAARVIEDHVINELGAKLTYEAYQGLHCGAVSGKPDGVVGTTEEITSARKHVFYGIFGGGPRMLQGALKVSDSIPVIDYLISAGLLPDTFEDEALKGVKPKDLFEASPVIRKDDFYSQGAMDSHAPEVVADYEAKFAEERQNDIERAIAKNGSDDAGADGVERGVRAMSFRQDVAIGVPFRFRMTIKGTRAQVGMLIAAIDRRLPDGIGGRSALGFGRVSGTIYVTGPDGKRMPVIGVEDGNTTIINAGADVYLDAQTEAVMALSLDDITRYMTPNEKVDDAKKKAKKASKNDGEK
jgi:CRISPR type IV-associated protein Csf2